MKKSIIVIIFSFTIILIILSSTVIFSRNESQENKLENKVIQEIDYLDKYLLSILGDFNTKNNTSTKKDNNQRNQQNNQNSNNNEINISDDNVKYVTKWENIQTKIEELYQTWNTISIDLHSINIEGSSILAFSDYLNSSMQNIKKKDKTKSMEDINKLYQLLPQYSESYKPNSKETNLLKIKNNVVNAYCNTSEEKWQEAQSQLVQASKQFTNLLNSVTPNFNNQNTVNQCYILTNELSKAAQLKDKDIFFIEYQNLMEKMEAI